MKNKLQTDAKSVTGVPISHYYYYCMSWTRKTILHDSTIAMTAQFTIETQNVIKSAFPC